MYDYNEIIEMEVLNGIDKAMHVLLLEYQKGLSNGLDVFCMRDIDELKKRIPEYIDKQFRTIIAKNLSDSVQMFPQVSE